MFTGEVTDAHRLMAQMTDEFVTKRSHAALRVENKNCSVARRWSSVAASSG